MLFPLNCGCSFHQQCHPLFHNSVFGLDPRHLTLESLDRLVEDLDRRALELMKALQVLMDLRFHPFLAWYVKIESALGNMQQMMGFARGERARLVQKTYAIAEARKQHTVYRVPIV
jgi:hypothetical protein